MSIIFGMGDAIRSRIISPVHQNLSNYQYEIEPVIGYLTEPCWYVETFT